MQIKYKFTELAQQILRDQVNPKLRVDGTFGSESIASALRFSDKPLPVGNLSPERWVALTIQKQAKLKGVTEIGFKVDGWWGPDTQDAGYRLMGETFDRPDEAEHPPTTPRCWTPSDQQMIARYGAVGTNQVTVQLPYAMRLDWDLGTSVTKVTCHKLFAGPITGAFEGLLHHYGYAELRELGIDRFGGILNVRLKRGGKTWSAHAWGTAIDLWPSANQLAWKSNRAEFAKNEYALLRKIMADAGLMSLGTCYNFDWMHWQLNP